MRGAAAAFARRQDTSPCPTAVARERQNCTMNCFRGLPSDAQSSCHCRRSSVCRNRSNSNRRQSRHTRAVRYQSATTPVLCRSIGARAPCACGAPPLSDRAGAGDDGDVYDASSRPPSTCARYQQQYHNSITIRFIYLTMPTDQVSDTSLASDNIAFMTNLD